MADIKTRDVVKGSIKTIDKAAVAGERMKQAYISKGAIIIINQSFLNISSV